MAKIVTEIVTLQISKLVKDDADDSDTILTADETEVIGAVVEEMDAALTGAVVEMIDTVDELGE